MAARTAADGEWVGNVCGELRWEGARQHAGHNKNVEIAWGELRWEGSETACWTERKSCKKIVIRLVTWMRNTRQ